jgi:hypothetical protein
MQGSGHTKEIVVGQPTDTAASVHLGVVAAIDVPMEMGPLLK